MDEYSIKLDRQVLKQLGSQLYGDTPSVIAELVANSYDADAKNVWITVDTDRNDVIVEDDGKGMSVSDINNSFLNIGYDKRNGNDATPSGRKIMGRKGIGKLAAFSLTNTVNVCSIKNGIKCGCILDFKRIIDNNEPEAIRPDEISFDPEKISETQSGTRIELKNVKKRVALSYRFIVGKLIRTFDVNDDDFTIHIRKHNSEYKALRRTELDFQSIMDTILIIGEQHRDKYNAVLNNSVPGQYKYCATYDEFVASQKPTAKNKLKTFPYALTTEDKDGMDKEISFSIHGWIGTVSSLPELGELAKRAINVADSEEQSITISDNRISLYSRGKLGEYDILAKVKNNRNSEAYIIGEIYADIFEDDSLADMAISNRRGYDEGDTRYIETIRVVKRLIGFIVDKKDVVAKRQKDDRETEETEKIKEQLSKRSRSKEIFEERLSPEQRDIVQAENLQFTRAITSSRATKKIFISHSTKLKKYGQFIVDVLEDYGVDVRSNIIFTGDKRLGVPQGKDVYDYLKECFREELMVIFLFGKAFYDSNICISEAGAAWATNQNCMNVVIDIGFSDVEKPSNNALSSIRMRNLHDEEQQITLQEFFSTVISDGLKMDVDDGRLMASITKMIDGDKYCDSVMDNPGVFVPQRKFLPIPYCPKCGNEMKLVQKEAECVFECKNVNCTQELQLRIE